MTAYLTALRGSLTVRAGLVLGLALVVRVLVGLVRRTWGDDGLDAGTVAAIRGACDAVAALAIPAILYGLRRALTPSGRAPRISRAEYERARKAGTE